MLTISIFYDFSEIDIIAKCNIHPNVSFQAFVSLFMNILRVVSEIKNQCIEWCEINQVNCILECESDIDCLRECNRDTVICIENCIETTTSSTTTPQTTISPSANAVLILTNYDPANTPMVIDFNGKGNPLSFIEHWNLNKYYIVQGNVNEELSFDFKSIATWYGCGVTFMDQFWYFGGNGYSVRQVFKWVFILTARRFSGE